MRRHTKGSTQTELDDVAEKTKETLLSQINIDTERLTQDQLKEVQSLITSYEDIFSEADVLAAFYGARQEATETVAEWGCRVESLLDEVKQQRVQLQRPSDEMLRTVLWTGLRQELKDVSSYHYDRARSFDELRVVLRRLEQQHPPPSKAAKPSNCKAATKGKPVQEKSEIDDLKAAIHQLTTEVRELKAGSQKTDTTKRQDPGKNQNHQQDGNEDGRSQQQTQGFNNWNSRGKGNYRGAGGNRRDLDLTPTLIDFDHGKKALVTVSFSNVSTNTVVLNPRTILCEVQPVTITELDDVAEKTKETLLSQINIDTERLTQDQLKEVQSLITSYEDIFSKNEEDVGLSSRVRHRIELSDERPFKQRHRMIPPSMLDEVRSHIQQLLASGVIRRSHSPWSSNIVLARRKDGRLRLCTDFRQLNNRTIKDAYALPRMEEILDCLSGSHYFSVLDMKSGYYQVEIEEEHKERTAFTVGPLGFYEYNRLPFGLTNSPATYQRLMEDILGDFHMKICLIYLDDIIIFARTYEEHKERLQKVFQRLREAGLKLAPKKCHLCKEKVVYVGHTVSAQGIGTDPAKTEVIRDWPTPSTPEEVRRFLGPGQDRCHDQTYPEIRLKTKST
nr:hypothetical protein BaRGS_033554 [Batillaria attramentaria]